MQQINVPLDRDTAIALIAQARQLPAADLEALNDLELEHHLQSGDVREAVRQTLARFAGVQSG